MIAPWTRDHIIRGERKRLKYLKQLSQRNPVDSRIKNKIVNRIEYLDVIIELHGRSSAYVVMKQVMEEFEEYLEALDGVKAIATA